MPALCRTETHLLHAPRYPGRLPEPRQPVVAEPAILVERQADRVDVPARHHGRAGGVRPDVRRAGRVRVPVALVARVLEARPVDAARDEDLAAAGVDQLVADDLEPRTAGGGRPRRRQAGDSQQHGCHNPAPALARSTKTGKALIHGSQT